jgi:hypothetical protein
MTAFSEQYSARELQLFGIGYVARKGHAGVASKHQELNKSASVKILADLCTRGPVSNIDLAFIRGRSEAVISRPDYRDAAGSMESTRRRLDMAPALRSTSIDHQVHRMHSAPPRVRPDKGFTYAMSECFEQSSSVGRGSRPSSPISRSSKQLSRASVDRSVSRNSESPMSEFATTPAAARQNRSRSRDISVPPLNFDDLANSGGKSQLCQLVERTEAAAVSQDSVPSPFSIFRVKSCHKSQDDQASLTTTASGTTSCCSSSQASPSPARLRRPSQISSVIVLSATSDEGYASYSRLLGSRTADLLEKRVRDKVLKEQKKALKLIR